MPLWKVYHPADAFSAEDKQALAERITHVYAGIPIPKFYAVVIFEEVANGNCFVGGVQHDKFIRWEMIKQMNTNTFNKNIFKLFFLWFQR